MCVCVLDCFCWFFCGFLHFCHHFISWQVKAIPCAGAHIPSLRCIQARSHFHINVCFPLPISSRLLPCLCGLYHTNAAALCHKGWGWGSQGGHIRHHTTVCLHQRVIWIIGPVTDTNHRLSVALAQAPRVQISFHLGGKLEPGELTRDTFPILHQQFGQRCRGYISYFEHGAQTICLRCIALHPKERQNWPRQRVTKTSLIGTLQFGSDTALCNEVTPPSFLQVQFHSKSKKEECNIIRPPSSLDLPASFHPCIALNS